MVKTDLWLWLHRGRSRPVTGVVVHLIAGGVIRSGRRRICGKRTRFLGRFRFVPGRCHFVGRMMGLFGFRDEIRLCGDMPLTGGCRRVLVIVPST